MKKSALRNIYISFILFFLVTNLNAQYSAEEIKILNKKSPFTEKKVDSILYFCENDSLKLAKINHEFSRKFYKQGHLNLAIKYAKREVFILEKIKANTKDYHNSVYLLGKYYMLNNELDNAILNYKKASILNFYPKKVGQSLCQLGNCYHHIGNFHKSIDYFVKGIEILKKYGKKASIISYCNNLSATCVQLRTKESALLGIQYLKYANRILKK